MHARRVTGPPVACPHPVLWEGPHAARPIIPFLYYIVIKHKPKNYLTLFLGIRFFPVICQERKTENCMDFHIGYDL